MTTYSCQDINPRTNSVGSGLSIYSVQCFHQCFCANLGWRLSILMFLVIFPSGWFCVDWVSKFIYFELFLFCFLSIRFRVTVFTVNISRRQSVLVVLPSYSQSDSVLTLAVVCFTIWCVYHQIQCGVCVCVLSLAVMGPSGIWCTFTFSNCPLWDEESIIKLNSLSINFSVLIIVEGKATRHGLQH